MNCSKTHKILESSKLCFHLLLLVVAVVAVVVCCRVSFFSVAVFSFLFFLQRSQIPEDASVGDSRDTQRSMIHSQDSRGEGGILQRSSIIGSNNI